MPTRRDSSRSGKGHPTRFEHRFDPRAAVQRDRSRLARRERGQGSFWRSIGVIGMVGWPIVLGTLGGTFAGRYFDRRFETGIRYTLMFMMVGVLVGSMAAWKSVNQKHG